MRKDGRKLKVSELDPMYAVVPHIMPHRFDAMNMIEISIPEAPLHDYINKKRAEGQNISHLALIIAAYVQTVAEFPELNRFVVNKRFYARNDISVSMVVLKPGGGDTMSKIYFDHTDTIFDVNRKMTEYIEENRKEDTQNSTDKIIRTLLSIPGLVRVGVNVLKWMDKHNLMPRAVIDASPFHEGLVITNLASIRTNHIFHHVYDFGTVGQVIAIGNLKEVVKAERDGTIRAERHIPLGVVMDERICNGHYYAQAFARMRALLKNPERLEKSCEKIVREYEKPKKQAKK